MEYLYIGIGITTLIIIVAILLSSRRNEKQPRKPSNLVTLGLILVVLGIVFVDTGLLISYSFIAVGVLLSIIDTIRNLKNKERSI